jgi:putative tricarboxylic transport membrane protein
MIGATIINKSPVGIDAVTPLARLTSDYHIIVVPTSSGLKTMGDLVAMLKNDPGKVSWAGGSAGGSDHVAAALIARAVGVEPGKLNYVAFSGGGESLAAVLSGAYTVGINTYSELSGQVQSGRLRALAIASPAPVPGFNAPTLKQSGIDLITRTWRFVAGAPELTAAQRTAVTEKLTNMARSAQWAKISESKGWQGDFLTGAQLDAFVADEKKNITAVLVELGLAK